MTGISHFLLTRFNVPTPGREAEIRGKPGWLERRFGLFERFCLPSVAAQDADFRWLIYFDEETPPTFRDRIAADREIFPFEPMFGPLFDLQKVIADIQARIEPSARRLITTRLDNDDAIARDFMVTVQRNSASLPSGTVLNYPNGLAYRNGRAYSAFDLSNPFTSMVEDLGGSVTTIGAVVHTELEDRFTIRQFRGPPAWLQAVHGDNISNRVRGRSVEASLIQDRFALHPAVILEEPSASERVADRVIRYPVRRIRDGIVKFGRGALTRLRR